MTPLQNASAVMQAIGPDADEATVNKHVRRFHTLTSRSRALQKEITLTKKDKKAASAYAKVARRLQVAAKHLTDDMKRRHRAIEERLDELRREAEAAASKDNVLPKAPRSNLDYQTKHFAVEQAMSLLAAHDKRVTKKHCLAVAAALSGLTAKALQASYIAVKRDRKRNAAATPGQL